MVKKILLFSLLFFFLQGVNTLFAKDAVLSLWTRDSVTGISIQAKATLKSGSTAKNLQMNTTAASANEFFLPAGTYFILVENKGYKPASSYFTMQDGDRLPLTIWLDPISIPGYLSQDLVQSCIPGGMGLIHGFIIDENSGLPVSSAYVSLESNSSQVLTDEKGYFRVFYPLIGNNSDELPPSDNLIIWASGYKEKRVIGVLLNGVTSLLLEDMEKGAGELVRDDTHKIIGGNSEMNQMQEPENISNGEEKPFLPPPGINLMGMDPPDTIRVGTSCTCSTCSGVSTMSLETYVRRGLNDEWISSWLSHSLKSGAIAYRAYGAWYVANPINVNYDICSTTCCQVNDSDTATSTDTATNQTSGFMLQKSNIIFRAEYSAENNGWDDPTDGLSCVNSDLSCGDGYAGSPAASWPCLSDSVCSGWGCFGHGRGECQWGTQRWANTLNNKLWNWITNHYYNANGAGSGNRTAYITSPITMPSVSPSPSTVADGDTFTINVNAINYAEFTHSEIMIGASLYSTSTGYISDPVNDTKVSLAPGSNNVSRPFVVPIATPAGSYDLLVSLYYDTNGDNAITSSDLSLLLSTYPGSVNVVNCISDLTFDWRGDYYTGMNFNTFKFSKSNSQPAGPGSWSDWGSNSPYTGCIPVDQFSVRWIKTVSFSAGTYRFTVGSDDGAVLYIDGFAQSGGCNAWVDRPYTEGTCDIVLSAGNHEIRLDYYENGGSAIARLSWSLMSNPPVPVPDGKFVAGIPLTASRNDIAGSSIHLNWGTCLSAVNYNIYAGPLSSVSSYGFTSAQCAIGTSGSYDWTSVPAGNLFFIIDSTDGSGSEGSWGRDSSGSERGGTSPSGLCGNTTKNTSGSC